MTLCDLDGVAYLFPFLFPICADRTDVSANKQRLPIAFLTRFQQNALFCSLFLIGHFNKMLLKTDAIKSVLVFGLPLLPFTGFLLEGMYFNVSQSGSFRKFLSRVPDSSQWL